VVPGSATLNPHTRKCAFLCLRANDTSPVIAVVTYGSASITDTKFIDSSVLPGEHRYSGLAFDTDTVTGGYLFTFSFSHAQPHRARLLAIDADALKAEVRGTIEMPLEYAVSNSAVLDTNRNAYLFKSINGEVVDMLVVGFGSNCAAGLWGPVNNSYCTPCPAGYYNPRSNRTTSAACVQTEPGTSLFGLSFILGLSPLVVTPHIIASIM
jgi:hypothetical protein